AGAAQVQAALNALSSLTSTGGSVTVSLLDKVYTVSFGGNLFGFNQPLMTATGSGGTVAVVGVLTQGGGGTVVASGAALQLQGSLTVAGEPLIVQGSGIPTTNYVPQPW